jgi:hypothetical protein
MREEYMIALFVQARQALGLHKKLEVKLALGFFKNRLGVYSQVFFYVEKIHFPIYLIFKLDFK